MSANDEHRGPSDPGSYSVSCKHERMTALLRTGLEKYNAEMARVAVERERQAKDAALQVQHRGMYSTKFFSVRNQVFSVEERTLALSPATRAKPLFFLFFL